jgi:hypothetical protein
MMIIMFGDCDQFPAIAADFRRKYWRFFHSNVATIFFFIAKGLIFSQNGHFDAKNWPLVGGAVEGRSMGCLSSWQARARTRREGLPDFSWYEIPTKAGKIFQITTK